MSLSGFSTVSEYVSYILRKLLVFEDKEKVKSAFTEKEEIKIKERLRDLGYID